MATLALVFATVVPTAAGADGDTIEIAIDSGRIQAGRHVVWAREGTTVPLVTATVPAALVGRECVGTYVDTNNDSIHLGNVIVVRSGGVSARFTGVEDLPGVVNNTASRPITLGSVVSIDLIMGPDEIFSAEASVVIACTESSPTTTTTTTTTTSSSTTTTTGPVVTTTSTGPPSSAPPTTSIAPATTTTVSTQILGLQEAIPAVAQPGTPSFTG
jgi:hypothetical protein